MPASQLASDNPFPSLLVEEQGSAPASPSASHRRLYVGTDGLLKWKNSGGSVSPLAALNKWDGTTAPTANDDSGDGYAVGSRWIDTTNDKEYVCLDATATAAVWTETTAGAAGTNESRLLVIALKTNQQAMNAWTTTNITWQGTDDYDPYGFHNPASNAERFTVPAGFGNGRWYVLEGVYAWDPLSGAHTVHAVVESSAGVSHTQSQIGNTGDYGYLAFRSRPLQLNEGQYLFTRAYHGSANGKGVRGDVVPTRAVLYEVAV